MNETPIEQSVASAPAPGAHPTNGLAIASLVTGILAILTGLIFIGFAFGLAAIILGAIGLRKPGGKAMSITGIITGVVGLLTSVTIGIFALFALMTGGAVLNELSTQVNDFNRDQQAILDARKDFNKGETGIFANLEVTVRGVERNYLPEDEFSQAKEGNELIVVDLSVTNKADGQEAVSSFNFMIVSNGVATMPSFAQVAPAFESGSLAKNANITGKIVYEVPAGATDLKLQYSTMAALETVVFTIKL